MQVGRVKICDFQEITGYRPISKSVKIDAQLLLKLNRKSYMLGLYRTKPTV